MRKLPTIGAGLFALLLASAARADGASLEGLLAEEVVTSVSRAPEPAHDAPALTRSISAEEIRRYGMTSVAEALDFLGVGVHVEQGLGRAELTVRGVNFAGDRGNHVLVLVDGRSLNEPLVGDAAIDQRLGVPLEMIDHIELVLGPGSAMYGSSAVLAVVNVVTKSAKTLAGFHAAAEAGALGTLRATLTTGQSFELLRKRAEITAGLGHFHQDGSIDVEPQDLGLDPVTRQRLVWGGRARNAYRSDITGLRLRVSRDGLDIWARAAFNDAGDPAGLSDFDRPDAGSVEQRASVGVTQKFSLGSVGVLAATVFAEGYHNERRYVVSRPQQCPFPGTCDYREEESSSRLGGDVRADLDWLKDGRVVTALGAGASMDRVAASLRGNDHATGAALFPVLQSTDVDSVVSLAANGQQTLKPVRWLDLIGGGRVDWRKIYHGEREQHTFTPTFTPRLAAAVRPWPGATTKLIYARAFRAPNPYEVDANNPTLILSHGLTPERSRSVEAIFEQRIDAHRFMFGAFRTEYLGIINRLLLTAEDARAAYLAGLTSVPPDATAPVYQFRTDDYVETRGFNAAYDGALLDQRLHLGASFTGTIARSDHYERVLAAPHAFGNARVAYDLGGKLPTAALAATFAGRAPSDRAYDAGYRSTTIAPPSLEVRATFTGAVPWVNGLSYRAIVSHLRHDSTPFAIGPTLRATTGYERTPLTPTQPWNAILGLQYDFGN
ncbi:MAG: TonB-dependent receptor [Labilithrix sp.]